MSLVMLTYTGVFFAIKFLYFERFYQLLSKKLYHPFNESKQETLKG